MGVLKFIMSLYRLDGVRYSHLKAWVGLQGLLLRWLIDLAGQLVLAIGFTSSPESLLTEHDDWSPTEQRIQGIKEVSANIFYDLF